MDVRNRRINFKRKPLPENIEELQTSVNNIKESIESSRVIVNNLKGNPGWLMVQRQYLDRIEAIEKALLNFHEFTDKGRDRFLQERVDLYEFINVVETAEASIEQGSEQISEAMARINDKTGRLRTVSQ